MNIVIPTIRDKTDGARLRDHYVSVLDKLFAVIHHWIPYCRPTDHHYASEVLPHALRAHAVRESLLREIYYQYLHIILGIQNQIDAMRKVESKPPVTLEKRAG